MLQRVDEDPMVGVVLADRYLIESCVGEGGMGRVYRARHQRFSRRFAIKILFGDLATDPKVVQRFAREAEAASRLDHPNLISVTDFGETSEGLFYLAMDYIEGTSLFQIIDRDGPLSAGRVATITRQLCAGLGHAHEQGLVHRDFKSENVIITDDGSGNDVAKVVDFGIATLGEESDGKRLTTQGITVGTPATMSPEQATGQAVDNRSDLYSLGVVMYEMLARSLPFDGTPAEMARQNVNRLPPPFSERVEGLQVPVGLESLVMKVLEKRPEDRFQNAEELAAALDVVMASPDVPLSSTLTNEQRKVETTDKLVARTRNRGPLLVAIAVLLLLGGGLVVLIAGKDSGQARQASLDEPSSEDQTTDGERPTTNGPQPTTNSPQPTTNGQQPTTDGQQPTTDGQQPTTDGQQPTTDGQQPAPNGQRPTANDDNPTAGDSKTTWPSPNWKTDQPRTDEPKSDGPKTDQPKTDQPKTDQPKTDQPKTDQPKTRKPPTTAALTQLYTKVGEELQALQRANPKLALPLRARYSQVPLNDALRVKSLRVETRRKLMRLRRDVRAARDQR